MKRRSRRNRAATQIVEPTGAEWVHVGDACLWLPEHLKRRYRVRYVCSPSGRTSVGESEGASIDLSTLTGAFLGAGAPSVIGTLWQVADESTTLLMVDFYEQLLELGAGESLRRSQLRLARSKRFAHPYFWAAFVIHGWGK